jgi:hypothetical protein
MNSQNTDRCYMQDEFRGVIHNRERAQQIKDFHGLRFGKITPTDIDAFIEWKDKLYIIVECKLIGYDMPFGQRLALERMCDSLAKDKPSILFMPHHNCPKEEDIDFSTLPVKDYYFVGKWKVFEFEVTLRKAMEKFIEKYDGVNNG